ncbi:TPA: hypothetical protein R8G81_000622 [Citrobacter youngae]|nr:hypothetical protein [Citrobacter youngae]
MKYLSIALFGMGLFLTHAAEAKEYNCSGVARNMTTNEATSGVMKARITDLGSSITVNFGPLSYTTSKISPEKTEGKIFPSGVTKEGNIIQRRGEGDYRFFQMSLGDVVQLTCE